jgi:hypothetical protein
VDWIVKSRRRESPIQLQRRRVVRVPEARTGLPSSSYIPVGLAVAVDLDPVSLPMRPCAPVLRWPSPRLLRLLRAISK